MLKALFLKKYSEDFKPTVKERIRYGIIGGLTGIFINLLVFVIEIITGVVTNSIAITSDAFHNLTDVLSSIIIIISFYFAQKPADQEHPFGHGRVEYVASLVVGFIVLIIGAIFFKNSFVKIIHPDSIQFDQLSLILILCMIPLKLILCLVTKRIGALINSTTLKAASVDALSDIGILLVAMLSLVAVKFISWNIDGYLGILVASVIFRSGYKITKDSLNPLLGEPVDHKTANYIISELLTYPYIHGVHDLVMHNYGPGRFMASVHAEVPSDVTVMDLHSSIDKAEKDIYEKYNILLVIHMDPFNSADSEVKTSKEALLGVLKSFKEISSIHDFRIEESGDRKDLVFDAVVTDRIKTPEDEKRLIETVNQQIQKQGKQYNAIIHFDRSFVAK